jgi:uncharacterized protein (DUF1330 family)
VPFNIPFMPAYIIARIEVTNWERYREYTAATPGVIERFDGRFIVRGGEVTALEGPAETRRVVVIQFPSMARLKEFWNSPEYAPVKKLREVASTGQFIAIEGHSG